MKEAALRLAEGVRSACLRAALDAYEDAGLRGLCAEGRRECALDAIRSLALSPLLQPDESESREASRVEGRWDATVDIDPVDDGRG